MNKQLEVRLNCFYAEIVTDITTRNSERVNKKKLEHFNDFGEHFHRIKVIVLTK